MTAEDLRKLYEEALTATHQAKIAEAKAQRLQAVYNEALFQEHAAQKVPMGKCIDVLGDGKVKPEADCAKDLPR